MKVSIHDSAVPIVITFRKILKKPKVESNRSFVGPVQMIKNLLVKFIDLIDESAFETKNNVIEKGQFRSVHWAVTVPDPWDSTPGAEHGLVAYQMSGDRPPCGAHFEVISTPREDEEQSKSSYYDNDQDLISPAGED